VLSSSQILISNRECEVSKMTEKKSTQKSGRYDMLQNAAGEILIIIEYREGGPENPRLVYDGGEQALLYRSRESAFMLNSINNEARMPLKSVNEVLMVEIENDDVAREYKVPVRVVRSLKALA
jgi:hypothetical protein